MAGLVTGATMIVPAPVATMTAPALSHAAPTDVAAAPQVLMAALPVDTMQAPVTMQAPETTIVESICGPGKEYIPLRNFFPDM